MASLIEKYRSEIITLCKKHRVKTISIFGSATTNQMTDSSDLDFLVQFSDDIDILEYADTYFSLLEGLENLTGKKVDLVTVKSLKNPILKKEIYMSKIDLYAA